jgi:hypothetical protein
MPALLDAVSGTDATLLAFMNMVQVIALAWIAFQQNKNHRNDPP